jgi:hypothetical protein
MATAGKGQRTRRTSSRKSAEPPAEEPRGNGGGPTLEGQPDGPIDEDAAVEISRLDGEDDEGPDAPVPADQVPLDGAMIIRKMTEDGAKYDIQMMGSMPAETAPTLFEKGEEIARERLGLKPRGRS